MLTGTGADPVLVRRDTAPSEAASEPAARTWLTWATRRPWLLAWLAFLPIAVLRAGELAEADTFWEIRTGLLTMRNMAIPATDPFSWTVHGRAWTLNSWGFNVVIALAYRLASLAGVAWVCVGLVMVIAALVLTLARMLGASPAVAGTALFLGSPLLMGWLSARPQLADYIAFMIIVILLRRIAEAPPGRHRAWSVVWVGITCVIWVNLHAGALLGVAVATTCAALLLIRRSTSGGSGPSGSGPSGSGVPPGDRAPGGAVPHRTSTARAGMWCAAAAVAALAGTFANPYGLGVIAQTTQVQAESSGVIAEWQHLDPASPIQDCTILIGLLALVLVIRRRDAVLTAALVVATAGSVIAIRSLPFVALSALPVLAAWASKPSPALASYARSRWVMFRRCGIAGIIALAAVATPSLAHIGRPDLATYPVNIVKDIPAGCRLFNTDLLGGFVILERPDVPVSLDTRNTLYRRPMLLAEERVLAGQGNLTRGLAGAGCVLVPPGSGLAHRLDHDPAWKLTASEPPAAVLFIRR